MGENPDHEREEVPGRPAGSWSWRTQETQRHRTGPMQIEKPSACPRRGDEGRTA